MDELEQAELVRSVVSRENGELRFVPAAPLDQLTVGEILRAVRGIAPGEARGIGARNPSVSLALRRVETAWTEIADQTTLASLASSAGSGAEADAI